MVGIKISPSNMLRAFDWQLGGPLVFLLTAGLTLGVYVGTREVNGTRGPHKALPIYKAEAIGGAPAPADVPPPTILTKVWAAPVHYLK